MNKAETVKHLHSAKKAHLKWVHRAKALIEGLPIEKEAIPVACTECQFGQWFYGEGESLNTIVGKDALSEIETLHFNLHDMYMKIFKVYFGDIERSFFSKLFNLKKSVSESDKEMARNYYEQLSVISYQLIDVIDKLERRLHAMSSDTFDESMA